MDHQNNPQHNILSCLDDDAPLENETFGVDEFFSAGDGGDCGGGNNDVVDLTATEFDLDMLLSHQHQQQQQRVDALLPHSNQHHNQQQAHQPQPQQQYQQSSFSPPAPPSAAPASINTDITIPLRHWIHSETLAGQVSLKRKKQSIVRKTTVAYGIAELLHYCLKKHCNNYAGGGGGESTVAEVSLSSTSTSIGTIEQCNLDNFIVRLANNSPTHDSATATIEGVDMISPPISVQIISPFFLSDDFFDSNCNTNGVNSIDKEEDIKGWYLEVEIQSSSQQLSSSAEKVATANKNVTDTHPDSRGSSEENMVCHLFGVLMYELFSERNPGKEAAAAAASSLPLDEMDESEHTFSGMLLGDGTEHSQLSQEMEPSHKKTLFSNVLQNNNNNNNDVGSLLAKYVPLKELGFPASLSLLVKNLLDCGWDEFCPDDAVPSLKAASDDLHLLLQDPGRFLFDRILSSGGPHQGEGKGGIMLDIKQNKLYGREEEQSRITDVFCRVSLTGESEALFIEGFSGSGKSKLVQSVVSYVDVAGGYIVQKKFDQISQERPMSVVLAAFDELCPLISNKLSPAELNDIVIELMAVFGNHLSTLVRVLPNVALLSPQLNAILPSDSDHQAHNNNTEINTSKVYFILQLFMRVVSSKSHPVMLFLDDLHWADCASLDMLQNILSDIKGASCVYFIGSYRVNEVPKDHATFRFMDVLKSCNVQLTTVRLDGMGIEDVNHIISDALGIFPRICKPLSQLVLRKTEGNPLFVLECLRSLVDRDLLQYSFRERRWVWDTDKISAEDLADNVCELLSTKMMSLPENTQLALKIASCFGNTINSTIVKTLMLASPKFSRFGIELEKAVKEGFMNIMDNAGSAYRFAHDKVREAAYGLIPEEERNQFHHDIGMLLYGATQKQGQNIDDCIFTLVDQINHLKIQDPSLCITIAELNHKAASKAMDNSNCDAAYFYSNASIKLLPPDRWQHHYDLSRRIFLVQGNAAMSLGHIKEATSALDEILCHGKSLSDKLDAYYLKISLLHARQEGKGAYDLIVEVLEQLGEVIPAAVDPASFMNTVEKIQEQLSRIKESDLISMKAMESPFHYSLMQFYNQVCFISYFVNPPMLKWYASRLVELSLEHGVCKYSALGIMRYAMVLGGKLIQDVQESYRVGKLALKLLERFDSQDLLSSMYLVYYGYIAVHIEPFQSCADMLKRGFEIGLSTGDTQTAFNNGLHYIQKSLISGKNLPDLKKECDYQMRLIDPNSQPMTKMYMSCMQESLALLITKEGSISYSNMLDEDDVPRVKEFSNVITFHRVIQSFWLGHYDRCLYHTERSMDVTDISQLKSIMVIFYSGISCFHSRKNYKKTKKLVKIAQHAVKVMKEHGEKSSWNYLNKIHLLEAEIFSASNQKEKAKVSFNTAITAARSAKFVNEQGLACELAALHCLRNKDYDAASNLFKQAQKCYTEWGSQVKVDQITKQFERIAGRG